ncbi:MAG: hypothetical protein ACRDP3_23070 [Streptomyces sp.]|uniref:hypothetical protein n=1 Tax=Streptomyces sp. TaxID=1931 RepID=UPI003D6C6F79
MIIRKAGRPVRLALAASGTIALLLTACGNTDGQATALSRKQAQAALPDREALPGWRTLSEPGVVSTKGGGRETACRGKDKACKDSRFYSTANFTRDDKKVTAGFSLIAYKNEQAAQAAYDVLWKVHRRSLGAKASKPKLDTGDRSNARLGTIGFKGEPGEVVQLRVGANLAWVHIRGAAKGAFDHRLATDLATVLTDRTQQAQSGKTPSAGLSQGGTP